MNDLSDLLNDAAMRPSSPVNMAEIEKQSSRRRSRVVITALAFAAIVFAGVFALVVLRPGSPTPNDAATAPEADPASTFCERLVGLSDQPGGPACGDPESDEPFSDIELRGAGIGLSNSATGSGYKEVPIVQAPTAGVSVAFTFTDQDVPIEEVRRRLRALRAGLGSAEHPLPASPSQCPLGAGEQLGQYVGLFPSEVAWLANRIGHHVQTLGINGSCISLPADSGGSSRVSIDVVDGIVAAAVLASPSTTSSTQAPDLSTQGSVPSAADDEAIRGAALGWLNTEPRDTVDEYVDDFDSIRDSIRAGMAQHDGGTLAAYTGRVSNVRSVSATEAVFRYDLLLAGSVAYANQPGRAVKVAGQWKVTRGTVCDLLAFGAITCPPRT